MAVATAVIKWAPYLMGKHFCSKTDHWALKFLTENKIVNFRRVSELLGYNHRNL